MKSGLLLIAASIFFMSFNDTPTTMMSIPVQQDSLKTSTEKLKFIILCFKLSPPYDNEINALNHLANEYRQYVSPIVIKEEDMTKYKELFNRNEFKALQDYILNKSDYQKNATSFPVILVIDKNGKIKNAWSGDKTEDGLKRDDFYIKIKNGLEAISKQ